MKRVIILLFALICLFQLNAQKTETNYNESDVPVYTLPDPLVYNDGSPVTTKKEWAGRRAELFNIFQDEVYGRSPEWKGSVTSEEIKVNQNALGGLAVRKDVKVTLRNGDKTLDLLVLLYLPHSKKPVPVFLGYNFGGNHATSDEQDITLTTSWMRGNTKAGDDQRGKGAAAWPYREILSRGYGVATIYTADVDPDFDDGFKNGVHSLFNDQPTPTSWGTISAWAWGLSRIMDYLETNPAIDKKKVIVIGHSRLGKTALWAGATDKRFAITVSNNSGCGGAALSNRKFGETVAVINKSFPHWFCDNFNKYNNKEENLPVDQHELLSLIAPRPVYVASSQEDQWADPKGEFLACVAASPVFTLLTGKGLPVTEMPPINSPVMGSIGYHIKNGPHSIILYDWQQYMDFADMHLKKK